MGRYLLSRLAWAGPIILAILVINFLIIHLAPGDPIEALVGDFPAPPDYIASVRHQFGLDQPLATQLWLYLVNLAHGNLGFSFANRQPVLGLLLDRARFTLLLMLPALTLAAILGVVLALTAAPRAGSAYDGAITAVSLFGYSVPIFWLGQVLIVLFAIDLRWLPAQGMISLREQPTGMAAVLDVLWHLILPAFSVTIYYVAVVARVARASVLDVLHQDFILTAKSKGLPRRQVLWRHVLPNALIPVITVIGYNFGYSLTGAILVETVFAWPGLGNLFITSISNRDYPVLQGIFLLTALTVVLANLITDLLYGAVDPRVRAGYGAHA
ncbi:MAG TPA: ABC transporter permease [Alphaproteobacteria bacterium]|nr:ABC transporter permease [Alphaproteobacteria bacterium]